LDGHPHFVFDGDTGMLVKPKPRTSRKNYRQGERGVVMLVALIVLVIMTLAGIALMRSMDTTNLIAGNLAFKQAATHAADTGSENAIEWLEANNVASKLDADIPAFAYLAQTKTNDKYQSGEAFWNDIINVSPPCNLPFLGGVAGACSPNAIPNAQGNAISFVIQRLCKDLGPRAAAGCAVFPGVAVATGNNEGAGEQLVVAPSTNSYYRITVKVVGPRNTVSYIQSIVAL
jgi:Tfp pilus assembly protein PilX